MKIKRLLGRRVLLERLAQPEQDTGVHVPGAFLRPVYAARVIQTGPDCSLTVGDSVIFDPDAIVPVPGVDTFIADEDSILAVADSGSLIGETDPEEPMLTEAGMTVLMHRRTLRPPRRIENRIFVDSDTFRAWSARGWIDGRGCLAVASGDPMAGATVIVDPP